MTNCDRCGKRFTIHTNYVPHSNILIITRGKKLETFLLCEDCKKKAKIELEVDEDEDM